jgi:nucleoside-diphosphate-sugar epimerase
MVNLARSAADGEHSPAYATSLREPATNQPQLVLLGAAGFIGSAILRQLANTDASTAPVGLVHALVHRREMAVQHPGVRLFNGSLHELPQAMIPSAPHVIVHCATKQIDDGKGFDDNLLAIDRLASQINSATRAVIFCSSFSVYGDAPQVNIEATAPLRPETALARSRAACEARLHELALRCGFTAIVLRPRFVVGAGDRFFLPGLARLASAGVRIGSGEQRYSVIDVDDYARIILRLCATYGHCDSRNRSTTVAAPSFLAFNVGYRQPIAYREIIAAISDALGLQPRRRMVLPAALGALAHLPIKQLRRIGEQVRLLADDRFGAVDTLRNELDTSLLDADPIEIVRRAANTLTHSAADARRN